MSNFESLSLVSETLVGTAPSIFVGSTTDSLATITTAGYLNDIDAKVKANDIFFINYSDTTAGYPLNTNLAATLGEFQVTYSAPNWSLSQATSDSPQQVVVAEASATPGTVRAFTGKISDSVLMTSGNLVGVRGEVDYVGASGGFLYGVQGKIIPTGVLSGSSWNAGVFGQLDISGATINAGQVAPIWGDYGATSGTLTDQTGLYGIAMTNTTAAVLAGQIYLYGGAQNLLLLSTNAGLSGVTYFINSGTSAGSWGNATPPTPSKVLRISVDGTQYYLPLVAQNT